MAASLLRRYYLGPTQVVLRSLTLGVYNFLLRNIQEIIGVNSLSKTTVVGAAAWGINRIFDQINLPSRIGK